ncbi:hypothetical protein [Pseudomonas graminis]
MNDIDMENKLLKSGFTPKEVRKIKYFVKKNRTTYAQVLIKLRRVFLGVATLRLIMTLLLISTYEEHNMDGFYGFLVGYVFAMIASEILAPTSLGAKIFLHTRKLLT